MQKPMLVLLVIATVAATHPAWAASYEVGSCLSGTYTQFTTIQAAVSAVPAGVTIYVCPGVYLEQVSITKPLTLQGQSASNADRPVVAVPPPNPDGSPGLKVNVTSISGEAVAAQVLVQNVTPPGNVILTGITVDGTGAMLTGCSVSTALAGIFYASGSSGTINEVTTRDQNLPSCGYGIWIENGAGPNQSITVENNSVHDMSWSGIFALSNQTPSTLTAAIKGNFVTGLVYNQTKDIEVRGIRGSLIGNVVTGGFQGLINDGGPVTISGNTVADISIGVGIAVGDGSSVKSNQISNVYSAFLFGGSGISPGPTVTANTIKNTTYGIMFNCVPNVTVKSNSFNDSQYGYDHVPNANSGLGVNSIYNIDTVQTGSCP